MRSRGAGVDTGDLRVEETGSEPGDVRRRGRRESPPEDLGPGDPCDKRSGPHDVPMPSARAGGSNLTQEVAPHEVNSSPHDAGASMANWLETNIQGGAVASTPSPQNCTGAVSTHAAQALNNAPARYDRAQLRWPTTPLTGRGRPIGLGVNLDGTATEPATEDRRGPHHGRCRPRQICFAPRAGWLSVHGRRHPREVSPLSRGVMSQPLSDPLQAGLRFLPRPLPAAPSAHLTAGLPSREGDGLTTLHRRNPRGLGPAFTPVAHHLRRMSLQHPDLATYRFGPSLSAPLARLCLRRLRRFTWVGHTTRPWSPTTAVLAVAISARAPIATLTDEDTLSRGLRTPPLPATHASVGG